MIYSPHDYQRVAEEHLMANKEACLFLDMGLGKTVITLTVINRLLYHDFENSRVLIIAPKKVAETVWQDEIKKWDHLKHLTVSAIIGNTSERAIAARALADIYIISRDNIAWLVAHFQAALPYDVLVIDELSSFKAPDAKRFKILKVARPRFKRVIGLTGTPIGNGLVDLWSEMYLIDMGKRLGKTVSFYRQHYLTPEIQRGHVVYKYKVSPIAEEAIYQKIGDICISMKAKDYLDLPEKLEITTEIQLPPTILKAYKEFEREQVLELVNSGVEISALNAAALTGKLLQYANGAIYDDDKNWHEVHQEKLDALEEIIEAANGEPVLVFYSYRHDLARIQERFKAKLLETKQDVVAWNNKEIPLMIAHPASAGHGLNLQAGGSLIVFFGLTWSLELYSQAIGRLHRQGQTKPVTVTRIVAKGTLDLDVLQALVRKQKGQDSLMNAVKALIKQYA